MRARFGVFAVVSVAVLSACGGGSGADAAPGVDAAPAERRCFDEACSIYCEGDVLMDEGFATRCPSELGSTCQVEPGLRIRCGCGSITAAGTCYLDESIGNSAVWATCYAQNDVLTFHVCGIGRTCEETPACFCEPAADKMCVAPALCPDDPDCV